MCGAPSPPHALALLPCVYAVLTRQSQRVNAAHACAGPLAAAFRVKSLSQPMRRALKPLFNELDEALTSQKKLRAVQEHVAAHGSGSPLLGKQEVMAILVKIPNTLRWPDALTALLQTLDTATSDWAQIVIATAADPRATE